ncbi:MAG: hypothetical protein GZ091_17960 [Paludibacter sp.]|nr:hypothetical protein [Paludibacter sp.]
MIKKLTTTKLALTLCSVALFFAGNNLIAQNNSKMDSTRTDQSTQKNDYKMDSTRNDQSMKNNNSQKDTIKTVKSTQKNNGYKR